ncbi:MAG: nucleotidyltransferase family protein [Deltaproteobacteria bacterium]
MELIKHHFDEDRLVEMAVREGVAGLLYKNLKKIGVLGYLGHGQIEKLQSFYYSAARLNLRLLHDLKEILREQSNPQVVLLQGIPLLQQIYKDIGLRPLTDIDLWVLSEYFAGVESTLTKLGYRNDPFYPKTFKRNSTLIDVNTHILWADRIKSRRFLINAGQKDIYENCWAIDIEGETAKCLCRTDQIIYLSLHAFKHNLNRLVWLVDIKNLLKGWEASDWAALAKRSRELGIKHVVRYILFYLDHLFGCELSPDARAIYEYTKTGYLERYILQKRLTGKQLPVWGPLILLPFDKSLWRRVSFILENLFPRPQVLRQIFVKAPDFSAWQLYLKRARQILAHTRNN